MGLILSLVVVSASLKRSVIEKVMTNMSKKVLYGQEKLFSQVKDYAQGGLAYILAFFLL